MKKKLLIVGDSFSADWTVEYPLNKGWVNMFSDYEVENVSQAGVSEYKIFLQLKTQNVKKFDKIIVCHTSPFRIPIKQHPIHYKKVLHKNCDLIYTDLLQHKNNVVCNTAINFFEQIYDTEYAKFTHELIVKKIQNEYDEALHISFFDLKIPTIKYFHKEFRKYRGDMNHLNIDGNRLIHKEINKLL